MRIIYLTRVSTDIALLFAVALFAVQLAEGTPLYFCVCSMAFILIAAAAFNTVRGLSSAAGAYIFFYSVLVVIIGLAYKAFLGERADSNLADPHTTMEVYVAGISGMFIAGFLSHRFVRRPALLENMLQDSQMYRSSIGCMLAGACMGSVIALLGPSGERIQSAFTQLNSLIPLGIILGVTYEVRLSGGRRSVNLPVILGMIFYFMVYGVFGFSKQGMLIPVMSWFAAIWANGYRFSRQTAIGVILGLFILFRYCIPFAQYGHGIAAEAGTADRGAAAMRWLEQPEASRSEYMQQAEDTRGLNSYYDTYQGFWERLQFISADDALINVTDEGRVFGLLPLRAELYNAVPRIFWPNKPTLNFGNVYAHEIGGINEEDTTTGISFSPTGEAFHLARWIGIVVIAPILWFTLFTCYGSLLGDLRTTPWGLLAIVLIAHMAPEGGLTGVIHLMAGDIVGFVFSALFATWVAPLIATVLLGSADLHRTAATSS